MRADRDEQARTYDEGDLPQGFRGALSWSAERLNCRFCHRLISPQCPSVFDAICAWLRLRLVQRFLDVLFSRSSEASWLFRKCFLR